MRGAKAKTTPKAPLVGLSALSGRAETSAKVRVASTFIASPNQMTRRERA